MGVVAKMQHKLTKQTSGERRVTVGSLAGTFELQVVNGFSPIISDLINFFFTM